MKLVEINNDNLQIARDIQNEIFPTHDATQNYKDAINGVTGYKYYLIHETDIGYIGVTGLFSLPADTESAWLGWFGILEKYRRHHYGSIAMRLFEDQAKQLGFKYCRVYTDRDDNEVAINFYISNGYSFESYNNECDPSCFDFPVLVGTKSICDKPIVLWNNRYMALTPQICKQTGFVPTVLTLDNLDEVTSLYEDCFLDNKYFLNQFKGQDLKEIMDTSFKDMFRYCIESGYSYGVFDKQKLVGITLCFDFFELKAKDPRQFNNIFTCNYDCTDYPYQHEFHDKVAMLEKPILYILAVAVNRQMRGKGIARILVNNILTTYQKYTIMSDVTNATLLNIFKAKYFNTAIIDDGYYLVYKPPVK